jgi:hypothetical protein
MPSGGETGAREPLGYHRDCKLANNFLNRRFINETPLLFHL